jgi:hypothetical protein
MFMTFQKKSTALGAALLLAVATTLTGCFGSSDTTKVTDAAKDATGKVADTTGKMAEGTKDAAGKVAEGTKDAAGKMADGAKDATGKMVDGTKDAAGKMADGAKGAAGAVTGAGLTKLVGEAKVPLVAVNSAVKSGDMAGAKTKFEKFEAVWNTISPKIEPLAGDKFAAIKTGVETIKTAVGSGDKTKAGEALTAAIKAMDGLAAAKK